MAFVGRDASMRHPLDYHKFCADPASAGSRPYPLTLYYQTRHIITQEPLETTD
jgi:hypothetical protein